MNTFLCFFFLFIGCALANDGATAGQHGDGKESRRRRQRKYLRRTNRCAPTTLRPISPGLDPTPAPLSPEPVLYSHELMGGFASVEGYNTSSTTGGEGGHVVIVRDAKSLAHWIKKGKKKKPLIVKVDGMIDVSSLRNAKNETMQMLSASSYVRPEDCPNCSRKDSFKKEKPKRMAHLTSTSCFDVA